MQLTGALTAALEIQEFLEAKGWRFCIIGGIASFYWGEPRVTQDVDLTLLTGFGKEEEFIHDILARFKARTSNAAEFALQRRVLLLVSARNVGIDISLGALPFEESAVARARKVEYQQGIVLRLCSPEDLIVFKAFAGRAIDWRDVEGVIARQSSAKLDWNYIEMQLRPLVQLKEQPELLAQLLEIRDRLIRDGNA
jgi:hypothetical protein